MTGGLDMAFSRQAIVNQNAKNITVSNLLKGELLIVAPSTLRQRLPLSTMQFVLDAFRTKWLQEIQFEISLSVSLMIVAIRVIYSTMDTN